MSSDHARRWVVLVGPLALIIGVVFWTIWPTPYRYDHTQWEGERRVVRIFRCTGSTQVLLDSGWYRLRKPLRLDPAELKQLEVQVSLTDVEGGLLWADVYNGSSYRITDILVRLEAQGFDRSGIAIGPINRQYRLTSTHSLAPMAAGWFSADPGFSVSDRIKWEAFLVAAQGIPEE